MNKISIKTEGESFNCFNLLQFLQNFQPLYIENYVEKLVLSLMLKGGKYFDFYVQTGKV